MLPNYQARSPFVLKHTTSMYICVDGWYIYPLNALGELFSPKKHSFLGLTPVYSEITALSKPYSLNFSSEV